ncbi:hypothetical protein BH23GEM10_BH23GEM10_02510 [soil metagenome]
MHIDPRDVAICVRPVFGLIAATMAAGATMIAMWAVFCYGGPIGSLLIAALYRRTGFGIRTASGERRDATSLQPATDSGLSHPLQQR